jgi:hypothetical protein
LLSCSEQSKLKDAPPPNKNTKKRPTQKVMGLIVMAATFSLMINHFAVLHPPARPTAVYANNTQN